MKILNPICLGLILILSSTIQTNIYAQVTIGSNKIPNKGAILELKQDDATFAPGVTASKGLGLPRVTLTDLKALTIGEDGDQLVIPNSGEEWAKHTGLLVYNVTGADICKPTPPSGLYVWTGTEWQTLGSADKVLAPGVEILTDKRDGEEYLVGRFGDENNIWMLENLRFNPLLTPTAGFNDYIESNATSIKKLFYYAIGKNYQTPFDPVDPANNWDIYKQNGILYNWHAATNNENLSGVDQGQGTPTEGPFNPARGICPEGWHLPSDREWNELEKEIYEKADKYSDYTASEVSSWPAWNTAWETSSSANSWRPSSASNGHGNAMKSPCSPLESSAEVVGKSKPSSPGGFNVLLIGRAAGGSVFFYGEYAYFWSGSATNATTAYARFFMKDGAQVSRARPGHQGLYTIRCRKDNPGVRADKDLYHIISGHDERGTTVTEVVAKITNDYANKPITIEPMGGIVFNPSLLTVLPAQATHDYKMQANPLPTPSASNPWQSKETSLIIKSTNDQGAETKRRIILNQTNYALSVETKFSDFVFPLASTNTENLAVKSNTKWTTIVNDNNNIIDIVSGTDTGGAVHMQNGTSSNNFAFTLSTDSKKYDTATVTFTDANSPKAIKDITVTIQTCMGAEDRINLAPDVSIYTDPRDGEEYFIGKFGNNTWMLENLRFNPVLNATVGFDDFTESGANSNIDKHFYYAVGKIYPTPFDPTNPANNWNLYKQNGMYYNWQAATNNENTSTLNQGQGMPAEDPISSIRGICPEGWHLPNDREWNELEKELYQKADKYSNYTASEVSAWTAWIPTWETATLPSWRPSSDLDSHGTAMKSICPVLNNTYYSRITHGNSKYPTQGGFNALLVGTVNNNSASSYGGNTYFWTSSSYSSSNTAWARGIQSVVKSTVGRTTPSRNSLMSVRCKQD